MRNGTVKKWDSSKGFGFIISDDDEDLFVHVSDLSPTMTQKQLLEGQLVGFDIRRDMKGDKVVI